MTKQELLAVLNADAGALGVGPINLRQLNDWIDEELIGKARPAGQKRGVSPDWLMSEDSVDRARAMVKSMSFGLRRKTEHRIFLWLQGFEFPFAQVRGAFGLEFDRFRRRQTRKLNWQYDHRDKQQPQKRDRFTRQIPDLDTGLERLGFDFPPDAVMKLISETYFGGATGKAGIETLAEYLANKFHLRPDQRVEMIGQLASLENVGLLGNSDEIDDSAMQLLEKANGADFEIARANIQQLIARIDQQAVATNSAPAKYGPFVQSTNLAQNSIFRSDWMISSLASAILAAFRSRTKRP